MNFINFVGSYNPCYNPPIYDPYSPSRSWIKSQFGLPVIDANLTAMYYLSKRCLSMRTSFSRNQYATEQQTKRNKQTTSQFKGKLNLSSIQGFKKTFSTNNC